MSEEQMRVAAALEWIAEQARNGMGIAAGCATTHGDSGGGLEMLHSILSDIEINAGMAPRTCQAHPMNKGSDAGGRR